ncbi:MAG: hypothetical protein R3F61_00260 [Myxococcota bacterium]
MLLLLLACGPKHPAVVHTFPGADGRSCASQRVVTVDPDPWSAVTSIAVRLQADTPAAVGPPRSPLAIVHPDDLSGGLRIDLDGELGPAACTLVPGDPNAEQRTCGPYTFSIHYTPLCSTVPMEEGLERMGRPETANFVLAQKFGTRMPEPDVRNTWNTLEAFDLTGRIAACASGGPGCAELLAIQAQMDRGLARLDALDRFDDPKKARNLTSEGAGLDWCPWSVTPDGLRCEGPHPLRDLLTDDFLLVDTRKRCTVDTGSFLEIELAHLQERAPGPDGLRHQTCGGRTPGDDVIDRLLTLTINGPDRVPPGAPLYGPSDAAPDPHRGDGVDAPPEPFPSEFPWLREPRYAD